MKRNSFPHAVKHSSVSSTVKRASLSRTLLLTLALCLTLCVPALADYAYAFDAADALEQQAASIADPYAYGGYHPDDSGAYYGGGEYDRGGNYDRDKGDYYGGGDYDFDGGPPFVELLLLVALPIVISALICVGLMGPMRSVRPAVQAREYAKPGSLNIRTRSDILTHTTQTRVKIERRSGPDGSGGISHHSGGGHSGRNGSF